MFNYIEKRSIICKNELSHKRFSFCPKDYRGFNSPEINIEPLKNLLIKDELVGTEIGSNAYLNESKYRFLKTTNIQDNYLISENQCEKCMPDIGVNPINGSIFIAKDGGGEGLGEVAYYENEDNKNDYISSGILNIKIQEKYKYYVLAVLKSIHFKTYIDLNTPEGSTIRHSKKIALEYPVVIPDEEVINKISEKVKCLIEKEKNIEIKHNEIDNIIYSELDVKKMKIKLNATTIGDIKDNFYRLDAGMYDVEYKNLLNYIINYKYGTYSIPIDYINSGSTPKIRVFNEKSKYCWVTPTDITDYGFLKATTNINMPTKNNLNKNSLLFINRTSKGGKGEYVGICMFYDTEYYGIGHHNQGIYRVDKYNKEELLFLAAFMNSNIMRKICSKVSYGTKMRELKAIDFSKFLIPNFPSEIKNKIIKNYFSLDMQYKRNCIYDDKEKKHNNMVGIYQLEQEIKELKKEINEEIHNLILVSCII